MILAKEQQAVKGDIIFWYITEPSKTSDGKRYSSDATCIDIIGYKSWLWNKIKLLLVKTYYFSDDDLRLLDQNLLYSSFQFNMRSNHNLI